MNTWETVDAVEYHPDRVSGALVFRGTRVPVAALFENLRDGATVAQFLEWFPGVTQEQVEAVLDHEDIISFTRRGTQMDTLTAYRQIIQNILLTYTRIPYAYGDIHCKPLFDCEHDSYALLTLGWHGAKRIHGCLVHVEIIDDKVWIQRDDTDGGIATELVAAGIPKHQIVLGFHTADVRPFTEYAVA